MRLFIGFIISMWAGAVLSSPQDAVFSSIDGGNITLNEFAGQPVLVVNTASQCAFTSQYAGLQALHDKYSARGLVVLAVPSDDFNQELGSAAEVKEFCEINYNLTLPMADLTNVRGSKAHAFYKAVKAETGFVPRWNFNKVLIGRDGAVVATWGASASPNGDAIVREIEKILK